MLSICIPKYNVDCSELIVSLNNQALLLNIKYEIIIIDDASSVSINNEIQLFYNQFKFIQLVKNILRVKMLLKETKILTIHL